MRTRLYTRKVLVKKDRDGSLVTANHWHIPPCHANPWIKNRVVYWSPNAGLPVSCTAKGPTALKFSAISLDDRCSEGEESTSWVRHTGNSLLSCYISRAHGGRSRASCLRKESCMGVRGF